MNNCLMALGRVLVPADYTRTGRFDHDAALEQHDTPLLDAVCAPSLAAELAEATARGAGRG